MFLLEEINNDYGTMGWVVAVSGAVITGTKYFWDYMKKRSEDKTKTELSKDDVIKTNHAELNAQYTELLSKFEELEGKFERTSHQLDKALSAFKIIIPLIESIGEKDPIMKKTIDNAIREILKEE